MGDSERDRNKDRVEYGFASALGNLSCEVKRPPVPKQMRVPMRERETIQ